MEMEVGLQCPIPVIRAIRLRLKVHFLNDNRRRIEINPRVSCFKPRGIPLKDATEVYLAVAGGKI